MSEVSSTKHPHTSPEAANSDGPQKCGYPENRNGIQIMPPLSLFFVHRSIITLTAKPPIS